MAKCNVKLFHLPGSKAQRECPVHGNQSYARTPLPSTAPLAAEPSLSAGRLARRDAVHPSCAVRRRVASSEETPPDVLADLTRDDDSGVREAAAENDNTPTESVNALLSDPDERVFMAAAFALSQRMLRYFEWRRISSETFGLLASMRWWDMDNESDQVRIVVALHPPEY